MCSAQYFPVYPVAPRRTSSYCLSVDAMLGRKSCPQLSAEFNDVFQSCILIPCLKVQPRFSDGRGGIEKDQNQSMYSANQAIYTETDAGLHTDITKGYGMRDSVPTEATSSSKITIRLRASPKVDPCKLAWSVRLVRNPTIYQCDEDEEVGESCRIAAIFEQLLRRTNLLCQFIHCFSFLSELCTVFRRGSESIAVNHSHSSSESIEWPKSALRVSRKLSTKRWEM
jgi:hypothetical protein